MTSYLNLICLKGKEVCGQLLENILRRKKREKDSEPLPRHKDPLQNVVSSLRTETTVKFFSSQLSRHVPSNLFCKYETRILGSDRKYVRYAYENMQEKCLKMIHKKQYIE